MSDAPALDRGDPCTGTLIEAAWSFRIVIAPAGADKKSWEPGMLQLVIDKDDKEGRGPWFRWTRPTDVHHMQRLWEERT